MRADLALVGFGHVGRRFARLIEERRDWLSLDYDLDCRVVGIATRHHGSVFREAGLDAVALAVSVEGGPSARRERDRRAAATASTSSAASPARDAPLKVARRDDDARHHGGPAGDRSRARRAAGRLPRRHREQGAGGVRVRRAERAGRTIADVSFLFEGAVMDGVPIFNLVRETLPAVRDHRLPRRRQQHDQPHPERARGRRGLRRRRCSGCRRWASRKRIRHSTWTAGTRRRRRRRWPTS